MRSRAIGMACAIGLAFALKAPLAADWRNHTQIVLQWRNDALGLTDTARISRLLETLGGQIFHFERHDISAGTVNFFIAAVDPDRAVHRVIELYAEGRFRPGIRIAVAEGYNYDRTKWTYRPVYPPDLKTFDLLEPGSWPSD